ncbi:hypothetical protein DSCW_66710 [Desulfosarcina widdelii]|uniref:Uncharacterized protein n=1 Tax=Desulfosarcina widdelii TaxID=947919 RepID=A0A5K7ZLS1_9BACT|nr:hypothetical protein [Desulfosarcina widdelii]BBO79254.1 hypothetical protein DSCW_66710 [Desulfosarcina widdelii]
MPQPESDAFSMEISAAEKDDLEKMIGAFRRQRPPALETSSKEPFQDQLDRINQKLDDLTNMILHIDRRMEPLAKVVRLSQQKTQLLNRRLDAVIEALKKKDAYSENERQ